jgi:myo-inositol-1(or 4)-monophosphatase
MPKAADRQDHRIANNARKMQTPRPETLAALTAVRAGLEVAQQRTGADQIASKGGVDIVTGADIAAERAIRRILADHFPHIPVVGEEGADPQPSTGPYWLVDPICGTRNYASRLALYCTNVALIEDGIATIAVVGDGGTSDLCYAERDRGAFSHRTEGDTQLHARDGTVIGLELGGKPPYLDPALGKLLTGLASDGRFYPRLLGTTLDFVKVASGDMAALVLLTDTPDPIHTAAGCLLAEQAGALVTDRSGNAWTLDSTTRVAAATRALHEELLRYLSL